MISFYLRSEIISAISRGICAVLFFLLVSCGKAYFPIELSTASRSERIKGQEDKKVTLVSMTTNAIENANAGPYKRKVVDTVGIERSVFLLNPEKAIIEKRPPNQNPGPYQIGVGDIINFTQLLMSSKPLFSRNLIVSDEGVVNILGIGTVLAVGKTEAELRSSIYQRLIESGQNGDFELNIIKFQSKKIFVDILEAKTYLPYTSQPIYVEDLFFLPETDQQKTFLSDPSFFDARITIKRDDKNFTLSLNKLLTQNTRSIRLFANDKISVKPLFYNPEKVILVGETGQQQAVPISGNLKPYLSEILLGQPGVLNVVTSDFSQIYVIRKKDKEYNAYHLDITNPVRISLANKFEMRPNDIVFVATQPLSLYSRALSQILGSTGLTIQARDSIRTEIGN